MEIGVVFPGACVEEALLNGGLPAGELAEA